APIFVLFLACHAVLILGAIIGRANNVPEVASEVRTGYLAARAAGVGIFFLFMRAYSMGAGTYTGIEAVSNGLMIMREPKVETGKRTMVLMAFSLSLTAAGIIVAYLLLD